MENISRIKEKCVGCKSCEQSCPKHCISMVENKEGFWYPSVDEKNCIECKVCLKKCPVENTEFHRNKAFDEKGIGYAKTAVGDKYVYENMVQNGHRIGGEQSGHIIFTKYARTGDGILTSLKIMEAMLAKKLPLSKLAEPVTIYPQVLINVRVKDKKAAQADADVQAAVEAVAAELGNTGRILVRESGTEPLVRVMVEAPDQELCQALAQRVVDMIKQKGHAI